MKTFQSAFALLAFMGLVFLGCSDKSQSPVTPIDQGSLEKVIITDFTCADYPIPPYIIDPGVVKLVGGNWIMKDVGVIEQLTSSDTLVAGIMVHYISTTLNAVTGEGPVHGSLTITPDANTEGGVWEGNYTGYRSKMPGSDTLFVLPLNVVCHGRGGTIEGMQMFMDAVITAWGTPPVGWYGSGEGFYKSH